MIKRLITSLFFLYALYFYILIYHLSVVINFNSL
nr:MAG TPA: hypothetical protein [Caudoviricetes sp.]